MLDPPTKTAQHSRQPHKLTTLPKNAKVHKRPLLRPAIPSPYTSSSDPGQQKTIYVSTKTPFMSAVKRAEKLLSLAEKRLVQSATTKVQRNSRQAGTRGKRYRGAARDEGDQIGEIARVVEDQKRKGQAKGNKSIQADEGGESEAREEVVLKGTGKAVQKCLQLALWFQQREDKYVVRLKTGTVGTVDDIEMDETAASMPEQENQNKDEVETKALLTGPAESPRKRKANQLEPDSEDTSANAEVSEKRARQGISDGAIEVNDRPMDGAHEFATHSDMQETVPETRIRYASVLEVHVSLR